MDMATDLVSLNGSKETATEETKNDWEEKERLAELVNLSLERGKIILERRLLLLPQKKQLDYCFNINWAGNNPKYDPVGIIFSILHAHDFFPLVQQLEGHNFELRALGRKGR